MTNHWIDMANADVVMVCGSNVVENHPIASRWLQKARERGAVILSVDPRYTRTSSFADHYCRLRSGTDIAFVGGMIRYALENNRIHSEYVTNYTNASFIISPDFEFHEGLFSGYDQEARSYDKSSWAYECDASGAPLRDETLAHERCVFQLLKKHFDRYDLRTVCSITGAPEDAYEKICDLYTSSGQADKAGTWLYAMGATQSTHGAQNIRTYAMLQLLLGNIGVVGGGVNALRGESNVQGSTDMALLFHILPGYLKNPNASDQSLEQYLKRCTPVSNDPQSANWWGNTPKYMVSLLKAWFGEHATPENNFAFDWLPKHSVNNSYIPLFEAMHKGDVQGLILFGQNPAVSGPHAGREREALSRLKWMIAVDLFETETAGFWKRPGVNAKDIDTEVFLLPAAASVEKEGSITNSGRWAQWRYKAVEPPGEARPDLWVLDSLCRAVRKEYQAGGVFPEPIIHLHWDYALEGDPHHEPDPHKVAREVNGYFTRKTTVKGKTFAKGDQVPSFAYLTDDGATCSGNWLYCNAYTGPEQSDNRMARRGKDDAPNNIGLFPEWSWCWPVNRRILYNRASVDLEGRPWNPQRFVIRWNPVKSSWEGDVPDGGWPPGAKHPFIMQPDGHGQLWARFLADGPLPEHYEPFESPIVNPMSRSQNNPAVKIWREKPGDKSPFGDREKFPIVATTYRMTEHWLGGALTRNTPWLAELVPNVFAEIGTGLAEEHGISNGDKIIVESARGQIEVYALVSSRIPSFKLEGRTVHQAGLVWHFGYQGIAKGDSANMLTPNVGDANTMIPEFKAFLCQIKKAERSPA
ncbi:formate dehydrogenase alpha subunit [Desulfatibacillum alkenivorans DSM 16219]|jgi:formate dehydrogenase major subunit|uniref:Formate dehydrogenase alpha subunit n=3 Tax=Desulfatibacillum alkenivorans TaxID=259354 RepID=A0A1M6WIP9_9BACT|nr:formate dehydrogenase alpha subunit [Desulfatibacillum alkenivorans DSM 16219]